MNMRVICECLTVMHVSLIISSLAGRIPGRDSVLPYLVEHP